MFIQDFSQFRFVNEPGKLFVVGGAVRDVFLGAEPHDIDFCVVGDEQDIHDIFGQAFPAHDHAPVFMVDINGVPHEVALARREISTGFGSEGFSFVPADTIEEDLFRRDFTVNAIAVDVFDGRVIDPFGGVQDIEDRVLRPVSRHFVESPERAGRAVAFIAIFGFAPTSELIEVCSSMVDEFIAIPSEQKFKQFFGKMINRGSFFVEAFNFMIQTGLIDAFPEMRDMLFCAQHEEHHPEGDVLTHTALTMEFAANQFGDPLITATMLMHDMGKPDCTFLDDDGVIRANGHEHHHEPIIRFMDRIHFPHRHRPAVLTLIDTHMRKNDIPNNRSRARLFRKLLAGGVTVDQFVKVIMCDVNGRGFAADLPSDVHDFAVFCQDMEEQKAMVRPPINGHDLMSLGLRPGPIFSTILDEIAEMFIAGEIETHEECMEIAREIAGI